MRYTFFVALLISSQAFGHPGRTDSSGGHFNRKTGEYHYHGGGGASRGGSSYTPQPLYNARESARSGYRSDYRAMDRRAEVAEQERKQREQERLAREQKDRERSLAEARERERGDQEAREREVREAAQREIDRRDRLAASKFRIAVKFYCQGNLPVAQKWVQDLAGEYSDTPTGAEAQQILAESFLLAMQSRVEEGRRVNSSLMMEGLDFREWQDVTGAYKVVAAFVAQVDGVVILVKQNGDPINVPMEKLCQADRDWANSQK